MYQQTLSLSCDFEGKGLHSGALSHMSIRPAAPGAGIVFVRTDLGEEIPAVASNVVSTRRSTTIGIGKAKVGTVEHVLAALSGMGIDNARIEIDAPEVPILDGSAAPYVAAFRKAGTVRQEAPRIFIAPTRELQVSNPKTGAFIKAVPSEEPSLEVTIDYGSRVLGVQTVRMDPDTDFASQIAPCRTFCFLHEVLPLLALGLARGGDVNNALVVVERPVKPFILKAMSRFLGQPQLGVSPQGYLDNLTLQFPDECGRHKLLDLVGDLRLCGGFLRAKVTAYKPGHALNTRFISELLKTL